MFGRLLLEITGLEITGPEINGRPIDGRRYAPPWGTRVVPVVLLSLAALPLPASAQSSLTRDYPTATRADYVFGCMAANGQTRLILERCSCSIDAIVDLLPYDRYVQAETILSMRLVPGQASEIFRTSPQFRDIVADLRRAQAEAEIECFP